MKKYEIVRDKRLFNHIIHNSKYIKNENYIIYKEKNNLEISRFGIAVGKKVGNAVTRNKIKRQMRVIIDQLKKSFPNRTDYIIIVKGNIKNLNFQQMSESLEKLIIKEK